MTPLKYSNRNYKSYSQRRQVRKDKKVLIYSIIGAIIFLYLLFFIILPLIIGNLSFINKSNSPKQISTPIVDTTLAPPVLQIPYESTNTAQIEVNGYALPNVNVEIYLDNNLIATSQTQSDGSFKSKLIPLSIGINAIFGKTINSQGNKSLASKEIDIIFDNEIPKLSVDTPQESDQVTTNNVTVSGIVDPFKVKLVIVNGLRPIIGSDGKFKQIIPLNSGDNIIKISASDTAGNINSISRKIVYINPTLTPTPSPTQ